MVGKTALDEGDTKGRFIRTEATFREFISEEHEVYKPEAGRYHLIISWACPWANRVAAVRKLKGLEDVIGLSVVHPTWQKTRPDDPDDTHTGWTFAEPGQAFSSSTGFGEFALDDTVPLPEDMIPGGAKFVRDIYVAATGGDPAKDPKKYTVPLLWDKKTNTIVNNESSDLIVMLNDAFNAYAKNPKLDLNPTETQAKQKELNDFIYPGINNGVYRCGFARSQFAYEEAVNEVYEALDKVEHILASNRYLCGDTLTLADIRLFMTLIRFDEVYVVYFKTNRKLISQYPNIHMYCRELYQMLAPDVINMNHIKTHYFTSHPPLNYFAIIPTGPGVIADLQLPHDRASSA